MKQQRSLRKIVVAFAHRHQHQYCHHRHTNGNIMKIYPTRHHSLSSYTVLAAISSAWCLRTPPGVSSYAAFTTKTKTTSSARTSGSGFLQTGPQQRPSPMMYYVAASSSSSSSTQLHAGKMDQSFRTWSFDKPCTSMEWNNVVESTLSVDKTAPSDIATKVTSMEADDLIMIGVMAPPEDDDKDKDDDEDDDDDDNSKDDKEPEVYLTGTAAQIDEKLGGALSDSIRDNAKTFKNGAKIGATTPTIRLVGAARYILVGLGVTPSKPKDGDDDKDKNDDPYAGAGFALGKVIATKCNVEKKVESCTVILPDVLATNTTTVTDLATNFYSTLYADNRYRTVKAKIKTPAEHLKQVTVVSTKSDINDVVAVQDASEEALTESLERGKKLATGVTLTKDIVNAPHNVLNSQSLADTAQRIAQDSNGRIKCEILNKRECEKRGMGAYLGVARGSETEPQFIHLTYTPPTSGKDVTKVGIIGKGLLFDTGGYNIKTGMMELMKFDCGGAAAVLGAARAVGSLQPDNVEAHFVVAACENMINEKAMVPSDILTASNGKTIEVMNTDAEGRLTLADALVFCDKEVGCERIIELSTLTGACMVSLGKGIAGVWTSDDDLATELAAISKQTGDKSWRMPMATEYNEQLESKFADLKNIGTRYGGAITAALFLQNFVSKKKPFAHIDIAGPVWNDKTGATGFGSKLVAEWVRRQGLEDEE